MKNNAGLGQNIEGAYIRKKGSLRRLNYNNYDDKYEYILSILPIVSVTTICHSLKQVYIRINKIIQIGVITLRKVTEKERERELIVGAIYRMYRQNLIDVEGKSFYFSTQQI